MRFEEKRRLLKHYSERRMCLDRFKYAIMLYELFDQLEMVCQGKISEEDVKVSEPKLYDRMASR